MSNIRATRWRVVHNAGALLCALALVTACDAEDAPTEPAPDEDQTPPEQIDAVVDEQDPIAALRAQLDDPDQDARLVVIATLDAMDDPTTVDALTFALEDVDFRVRRDAAGALGDLGHDANSAVPALTVCLEDYYAFVRERAVVSLTRIGGDDALEALRNYARTVDIDSVDQAMDALGTLGDARAIPEILPYATNEDLYLRNAAHRAFARIGAGSAPAVRDLLSHAEASVRCSAARTLGVVGDASDIPTLRAIADSDEPIVQLCALGGIGRIGESDAVTELATYLQIGVAADQRRAAIRSLALIGSQAAINRIIDALAVFHDPTGEIENDALDALIALGESARSTVGMRLSTAQGITSMLLANALAISGGENDIPAIRQAIASQTDPAVITALEDAIQSITDRENAAP